MLTRVERKRKGGMMRPSTTGDDATVAAVTYVDAGSHGRHSSSRRGARNPNPTHVNSLKLTLKQVLWHGIQVGSS